MNEVPFRLYHVDGTLPTDPHEIFVFGSNLAGVHGKGAALIAKKKYNAAWGVGRGPMGQCYAIPTKDYHILTLPYFDIRVVVEEFVEYTRANRDLSFFVTSVGCGLAGLTDDRMAPLFRQALNCNFPDVWQTYLEAADALTAEWCNPL